MSDACNILHGPAAWGRILTRELEELEGMH